jgi:hypothetical protein
MNSGPLLALQGLLARINDSPITQRVTDYLIGDAQACSKLMGRDLSQQEDEQVLICEQDNGHALSVYIDERVIERLQRHDPLQCLSDINLRDFCTVVEGISHFQYLVWCLQHQRQVSLLELELQAEVDKYAAATCLIFQQAHGKFQAGLHRRLFSQVSFLPTLDHESQQRYSEANRSAARFCRRNDQRFLNCRQPRLERWLGELRALFRCGHHEKLRRALC